MSPEWKAGFVAGWWVGVGFFWLYSMVYNALCRRQAKYQRERRSK